MSQSERSARYRAKRKGEGKVLVRVFLNPSAWHDVKQYSDELEVTLSDAVNALLGWKNPHPSEDRQASP